MHTAMLPPGSSRFLRSLDCAAGYDGTVLRPMHPVVSSQASPLFPLPSPTQVPAHAQTTKTQTRPTLTPIVSLITRSRVDAMIKRLAHAAGFDTSRSRWSTHSMRAGGATSLSFLGVPAHIIRAYGRWHSDSMLRYLSISHDEHRNIAGLMASMPARDDETRRVAWISLRQQI